MESPSEKSYTSNQSSPANSPLTSPFTSPPTSPVYVPPSPTTPPPHPTEEHKGDTEAKPIEPKDVAASEATDGNAKQNGIEDNSGHKEGEVVPETDSKDKGKGPEKPNGTTVKSPREKHTKPLPKRPDQSLLSASMPELPKTTNPELPKSNSNKTLSFAADSSPGLASSSSSSSLASSSSSAISPPPGASSSSNREVSMGSLSHRDVRAEAPKRKKKKVHPRPCPLSLSPLAFIRLSDLERIDPLSRKNGSNKFKILPSNLLRIAQNFYENDLRRSYKKFIYDDLLRIYKGL